MIPAYSFEDQWKEFNQWWRSQNNSEDVTSFEKHFKDHLLFHTTMTMSKSMTVVVDLRTMQYLFITGDAEAVTGWSKATTMEYGVKFAYEKSHPDDRILAPLFGQLMIGYFKSLPQEQKLVYKSYWDLRFVRSDGKLSRALLQDSILKHDSEGNMILLLSLMTDISTLKSDKHSHLRMTNGVESRLYEYNQVDKQLYTLECPSDRELDVFRHISQGHQRKQIADKMGISLATVKTHCQHTFEKLRTNDSVETINLLKTLGLLH